MTIGNDFPVVGRTGVQRWWVIPEGFVGQLVGGFSTTGPRLRLYTVKEAPQRPSGSVAGPYASKALAQAQADKLNNQATATPQNIAASAAGAANTGLNDLAHRLTEQNTWIRVGEFVAGGLLLYIGAKAFFPTTVNTVTSGAKKAGKAFVFI